MPRFDFAVVDVETTGFSPGRDDRIVEIAIVRLDAEGQVTGEFATLVKPDRDVGPTHVHGIEDADVAAAPRFADIAGDVARRLAGAVFTAHNVGFDLRFVAAEYERLGHRFPALPTLCTMSVARQLDGTLDSYNLDSCCARFGIRRPEAHSALHDARAAARLLQMLLHRPDVTSRDAMSIFRRMEPPPGLDAWPTIQASGRALPRGA